MLMFKFQYKKQSMILKVVMLLKLIKTLNKLSMKLRNRLDKTVYLSDLLINKRKNSKKPPKP